MTSPLVIDGSTLEGGGQILRNSVALAALLSKPIQVVNIRANRKSSGLKSQHAAGIKLVGDITGATIEGAETGSHSLTFTPGQDTTNVNGRTFSADAKTAGSTTLLLQISLPCLLFAPNPSTDQGRDAITALDAAESALLTVKGGTNAANAPAVDYTQHIFLPFLRKHLGLQPTLEIRKRGFYPRGGGELFMRIPTVSGPLKAFNLTKLPGRVTHIRGRAFVAGALPIVMAEQMSRAAHDALRNAEELKSALPKIEIEEVKENDNVAVGSGSGVFLWAETEDGCIYGGASIGQKGRDTAKVGKEAAHELMKGLLAGGCVDEYLQDQLIIFMALAEGTSSLRTGPLTLHTRTAIWVAEQLTGVHFEVDESQGPQCIIRVTGMGYSAKA